MAIRNPYTNQGQEVQRRLDGVRSRWGRYRQPGRGMLPGKEALEEEPDEIGESVKIVQQFFRGFQMWRESFRKMTRERQEPTVEGTLRYLRSWQARVPEVRERLQQPFQGWRR